MPEPLRALLVEDSAQDADLLALELRRGGFAPIVRRVDTEDDVRAAIEEESWDVALVDWSLPALSAPRAIEVLRHGPFEGSIIVVSGVMGEEFVVEAMRSGASDYIVKSDLSRLSPAVRRELETESSTRRAEGRLAVSEARLRSLLESIPAATYVAVIPESGSGLDIEYISAQIMQMIGYSPEEIVRKPGLWYEILHPDDRDAAMRAEADHLFSGADLRHEYRIIAKDGRVVWVRNEAAMKPASDGHPSFSQGVIFDITESKRTEEALRRQALIFDNVHDAVVIVDLEGLILDINPGAEAIFGLSSEQSRGQRADFLAGMDLMPEILAAVERYGRWSGEVPVHRIDGDPRVGELVVVPLKDGTGERLGTVGVLRDVTERRRADEELRRTVGLLRTSDQERRQLVSRLVTAREEEAQRIAGEIHDDPIQKLTAAAIRLGMLHKEDDDAKRAETIGQIQAAVSSTLVRLRRMLFELSPRALETGGLGQALSEYVQYANEEDATVYLLEDELKADLDQEKRIIAYRVVLEALSNVRKHATAKSATISLEDRHGGVHCRVTDDGIGMSPEVLGVSLPGHIGTASMRQRVEMAGGWIEIESQPGGGTTVEFWLPGD
jgi:PAS domain S-box-containing protein